MMYMDIILLSILMISFYTDFRYLKIYNAVLFPGVLLALGFNTWQGGMGGLVFTVKGLFLGVALLYLPFLLGGMGAGDVKLLAVVGAFKGTYFVFYSFILTAILGGVISLILLGLKGRLPQIAVSIGRSLKVLIFSRFTVWNLSTLNENDRGTSFPYGTAIVLGSLWTYWVI